MKNLAFVLIVILLAFFAACQKDEPITPGPGPGPGPDPNITIRVDVDFSSKPDDLDISGRPRVGLMHRHGDEELIVMVDLVLPITTLTLTGELAQKYVNDKMYVFTDFGRCHNHMCLPTLVIKKIDTLKPLPTIHHIDIPVIDTAGYYEIIEY